MRLDLCARRRAWVAGPLRPAGLFCRVLALPVVVLFALLRCYPFLLNLFSWNVGSYRAQSAASVRRPRGAHFPCLGKPETGPPPTLISRR